MSTEAGPDNSEFVRAQRENDSDPAVAVSDMLTFMQERQSEIDVNIKKMVNHGRA
ncbi:MAG: hypothetical protein Q8S94_13725 [Pseudohongiella sp.]|nr:hypothetical protein [Pseudohongiella sp.]